MLVGMPLENALVNLVSGEDVTHLLVTDRACCWSTRSPLWPTITLSYACPFRARYLRPSRMCSTSTCRRLHRLPSLRRRPLRNGDVLEWVFFPYGSFELQYQWGWGLTFSWIDKV
jgi:hypothetical protein